MASITLTDEEAQLTTAALDGLAAQLAARAERMHHGPAQLEACAKVGTLRRIARRIDAPQSSDASQGEPKA